MKDKTICKCCGKEAEWTYYNGPFGIEEEYIRCQCGYDYEFAYGYHIEKKPGDVAMTWSHLNHERVPLPEEVYLEH